MDEISTATSSKMQKTVDVVRQDLATIRTGKASPALLENLVVEAYGTKMKLLELATISAPDTQTLIVTPFDQTNNTAVLKAIEGSGMGFTAYLQENIVRVVIPPLSQERREEFVKLAGTKIEGGKIMIRQIRHDVMEDIKSSDLDEDTSERLEKEVQHLTDKYVSEIESLGKQKEAELMQI